MTGVGTGGIGRVKAKERYVKIRVLACAWRRGRHLVRQETETEEQLEGLTISPSFSEGKNISGIAWC